MKYNTQRVRPGLQQRAHVNSPAAEHIVRRQYRLVIQEDLGEGIEPVEDEIDMLVLQRIGVNLERRAIFPIRQTDPLQVRFVVAVKGIGDQMGCEKIGLHHAGNLRLVPAADFGMGRGVDGPEFPCGVQRSRFWFRGVQGCNHGHKEKGQSQPDEGSPVRHERPASAGKPQIPRLRSG